ncbi:MerR family transcriptional regulator, partial [Listeria monocytogenes]|nr:MerR family transcriptional regulator [Listeria monocytogenes]EJX2321392.1 MerR family transcriptional regulator [Listeria monocytogenes]
QQKDLAETISFVAKKVDGYREKL